MRNPFARAAAANHAGNDNGFAATLLAQRLHRAAPVPAGALGIAIAVDGSSTRFHPPQNMAPPWQKAFLVQPGGHRCHLCLHPATPEIALDLRFVLDSPDPRVPQQRFDLFLASEIDADLTLAAMVARLQTGLQAELACGGLDCFPQMSPPEWMRFRAQLERWLYTRFGLTVEDCALIDVGEQVDYAQILLARAADVPTHRGPEADAAPAVPEAAPSAKQMPVNHSPPPARVAGSTPAGVPHAGASASALPAAAAPPSVPVLPAWLTLPWFDPAAAAVSDAASLRRLFLELPDFARRWRALNPPSGFFALQQSSMQRLSLLLPQVACMPALMLAAPGQPLANRQIAARCDAMRQAMAAWEQAWSLLARLDDADRTRAAVETAAAAASTAVVAVADVAAAVTALSARWQAEQDAILRIIGNLEHGLALRARVPEQPA